jgi:hypothetical protein
LFVRARVGVRRYVRHHINPVHRTDWSGFEYVPSSSIYHLPAVAPVPYAGWQDGTRRSGGIRRLSNFKGTLVQRGKEECVEHNRIL